MFFFFKQKTAYEMRISDWSSDVCSSDLEAEFAIAGAATSDDTIRPAIRNFRRISNIPFEKEFGHRYHCHCDHARKLSRERMGAAKKHALCCDCSKLFLNNPAVGTFKRHRAQDAGAIGASIQADATGEFDNFFKDRMAVNNRDRKSTRLNSSN